MKSLLKALLPKPLLNAYFKAWAYGATFVNFFPSKKLVVIGITGTKGKSTVSELVRAILTENGGRVALASTIEFRIGDKHEPNLFKMTMPGHGYLQSFMRRARSAGCTHAVIEMTSEGARQFRHKGIELDALVFTNLQPEHIESHGSMEKYVAAKLSLAHHLADSSKRPRISVANTDDEHGEKFLNVPVETRAGFSLKDAQPYNVDDRSVRFLWRGELFSVPLPGLFNLYNCLAALTLGEALGIETKVMKRALERINRVAGRAERVDVGQPFGVIVDYAHTPDSLKALYETYKQRRIIAVLGLTGGGRDTWKRPAMGTLADTYADVSFLTNEDPYDEDPRKIVEDMAKGFSRTKPFIVIDRRQAIREALKEAKSGDVVLITGKGTDPYIMGAHGSKETWSDVQVATEELQKLGYH